jgi:O-antigen/teichoic acid export membrane protein
VDQFDRPPKRPSQRLTHGPDAQSSTPAAQQRMSGALPPNSHEPKLRRRGAARRGGPTDPIPNGLPPLNPGGDRPLEADDELEIDEFPTMALISIDPTMLGPLAGFDQFGSSGTLHIDQFETRAVPVPPLRRGKRAVEPGPPTADEIETVVLPRYTAQPARANVAVADEEPVWERPTTIMAVVARAESFAGIARRLMKSSGMYAIAALGVPAVSLLLTPFLAHHLVPQEYGALAILTTAISFTAGITQLGLGPAFFRAYNYDFTSERDRRSVLATVTLLLALLIAPTLIAVRLTAPELSSILLGRSDDAGLVSLAITVVLVQNLTVPCFAWLRAENRAFLYSAIAVTNALVTLGATIVFVGVLQLGVRGALYATGAGYTTVAVMTVPALLIRSRLRVSVTVARSLLSFGAPSVMSVVSMWVLQLSDRYLLEVFGDLAQTASYAVAYSLGSVLSTLVLSPFSLAWPTAMYTIAKRRDATRIYQRVFRWFGMTVLFAAFGLSLVSTVLFNVLFPRSYHGAAPVIPIVAESLALYGVYTVFMIGANIRRKTWLISVLTTAAALVNLGCNLVLIPRMGAMGAALSTLIAYFALAALAYIANQMIYPIPFEIGRFLVAAILGAAVYYEIVTLPQLWGAQYTVPLAVGGLLLYACCLVLLAGLALPRRPRVQPSLH